MKKLLIAITMVSLSATVSAKAFSMEDYKAKTGGEVKKVEVKKEVNYHALVQTIESNNDRLKLKLEKIKLRKSISAQSYTDRSSRLSKMVGDKTASSKSLADSRKTKMAGFAMEESNIAKQIKNNIEKIDFYKECEKLDRKRRSLVARNIIKSHVSV